MQSLSIAGAVAYPFAVWYLIGRFGVRAASLFAIALALPLVPLRMGQAGGHLSREAAGGAAALATLCGLSLLLDDRRFLLAVPALINAILLAGFGSSLLAGRVPLVERIARSLEGELSDAQRRYCRTVTIVWCGFFVANGSAALALALFGSLEAWSVYNGFVAYVLMGTLFAVEYAVRRLRFHR